MASRIDSTSTKRQEISGREAGAIALWTAYFSKTSSYMPLARIEALV